MEDGGHRWAVWARVAYTHGEVQGLGHAEVVEAVHLGEPEPGHCDLATQRGPNLAAHKCLQTSRFDLAMASQYDMQMSMATAAHADKGARQGT